MGSEKAETDTESQTGRQVGRRAGRQAGQQTGRQPAHLLVSVPSGGSGQCWTRMTTGASNPGCISTRRCSSGHCGHLDNEPAHGQLPVCLKTLKPTRYSINQTSRFFVYLIKLKKFMIICKPLFESFSGSINENHQNLKTIQSYVSK